MTKQYTAMPDSGGAGWEITEADTHGVGSRYLVLYGPDRKATKEIMQFVLYALRTRGIAEATRLLQNAHERKPSYEFVDGVLSRLRDAPRDPPPDYDAAEAADWLRGFDA